MSRRLEDLSSQLYPLATILIARIVEQGIAVMIVDTLRTAEEHQQNLLNGTSAATMSRHLPRRLRKACAPNDDDREKSDAIDLAPYAQYQLHGPDKLQWDTKDPAWKAMGEIGESLGLVWGGRWMRPHDPGHFELKREVWMKT